MNRPETFLFLLIAICQLSTLESMGQITGTVRDADQQPLPLVNVIVKQSNRGGQTDSDGRYSIRASRGDTLVFSHIGMHPVELRVKRSKETIRIEMQSDTIALEEVEVKAAIKRYEAYKSQKELLAEYKNNKNLIKTSWRILDKDLSSSYFRIIDGDDLNPAGVDFLASLKIHIPKMRIVVEQGETKVFLGGSSPQPAIFDVDGFLFDKVPSHINVSDIYRIAVLGISGGGARYGPAGAGGVIVINTRAQTDIDDMSVDRSEQHRKFLDSLTRVSLVGAYESYESPYFGKIKKARTEKKTLTIYEDQKNSYSNDPYFFLDVYDYYLSRWGNNSNSKALFQDVRKYLPDNSPELKALAYLQQQYGNYESALGLYIQILLNESWEGQALRDVANSFAELGDIKKAWMYYTQYIDIQNQLADSYFDAFGGDQLITMEMMEILDRNKEPFLNKQDQELILDDDMRTRLVFEWNNEDADFQLQFVTPEGFYDTWVHQPGRDASQDPEIAKGYCSKQFFLGKENLGLWQVNLDYKGNNSELPTYLKVSVYRNFGLADQDLEVRVYRLTEIHERVQLFTLNQY